MPKIKLPALTVICLTGFIIIEPSVYTLLIFLCVLLHEAGHILVMAFSGIGIESVTVLPVGIDIKRREKYLPYYKDIAVSLAGAAVNILAFFIFRHSGFFAYTNLLYAIINLIPVKGLDGGYALEAFLLCFLSFDGTQRLIRYVSMLFCILLWMLGIYILLFLNGNISIFALSVFLFVSVIMK